MSIDFAARRRGIGGSDLAAILGLSPWATPVDVWMQKTGRAESTPTNARMHWGNTLEQAVAAEYARVTGYRIARAGRMLQHPTLPLVGHLDRVVSEDGTQPRVSRRNPPSRILEVKTSGSGDGWGEEGTDEIPPYYATQCIHYLGLSGAQVCDVAVLIRGSDFRRYIIERDEALIEQTQTFAAAWWERHVVADVAPAVQTVGDARALWPRSGGASVTASAEIAAACIELAKVKGDLKELDARESELTAQICATLGEAEILADEDGRMLASWKSDKDRTAVAWQKLAEALEPLVPAEVAAELRDQHTTTKPGGRRFLLKASSRKDA